MERLVYPRTVVSVSWNYKYLSKRAGLVQSGHHLFETQLIIVMI